MVLGPVRCRLAHRASTHPPGACSDSVGRFWPEQIAARHGPYTPAGVHASVPESNKQPICNHHNFFGIHHAHCSSATQVVISFLRPEPRTRRAVSFIRPWIPYNGWPTPFSLCLRLAPSRFAPCKNKKVCFSNMHARETLQLQVAMLY